MMQKRLAVLGAGNMGGAIVRGALAAGLLQPGEVVVADPDEAKRGVWRSGPSPVDAVGTAAEAVGMLGADGVVLLATKPQVLGTVAAEGAGKMGGKRAVAIMAGKPTGVIAAALGGDGGGGVGSVRVVRVMPNLAVLTGRGMSAVCGGQGATAADVAWVTRLFGSLGAVVELPEDLFDAFTAVAGSGPGYVCLVVEALAAAGERVGLPGPVARQMAEQTLIGTGSLLEREAVGAAVWRARVTSPGGTPAAGLRVLEGADVRGVFARAVEAARDRGRELAG
ncbi:MAG: pyrroline-5-carboxylate reductase [Phycisphaerales bacterium]|nr:pyrroline-5-carboxylate reductase [Phycisphaerales bacterium]